MRRTLGFLLVTTVALAALPAAGHPAVLGGRAVTVAVDAAVPLRPINRHLTGVDWTLGTEDAVDDLHPNLARADIAFQLAVRKPVTPGDPPTYDWSFAESWVREAQAAGAEPMLILDYMPAWLASSVPGDPRDPTHLPPSDYTVWERIVYDGVLHFARDLGVRLFEVWNEPDWVGFWEDTPASFLATARHTAIAVHKVQEDTGIKLELGGPGCLFPNPECVAPWLAMMRSIDMAPGFVSWHWYGNYPFLGPDGSEPSTPDWLYTALGHTNPAGGVGLFATGIRLIRSVTQASLAGTGWEPELILDEWNVSAGGFDKRNDTHEGAAFDAGVLAEFQRNGLSRSAFFISKDPYLQTSAGHPGGDWGLVMRDGTRKPAWWTFRLWDRMAPQEVAARASSSEQDGFWAIASRGDDGRVTIMISSFLTTGPHAHDVTLRVRGLGPVAYAATIYRLDPGHTDASSPAGLPVPLPAGATELALPLPANSVAFVELVPAG